MRPVDYSCYSGSSVFLSTASDLVRFALAINDGDVLGGIVSSLMIFPARGLVVAVISNTSYADTPALGLTIAEAFATPPGR